MSRLLVLSFVVLQACCAASPDAVPCPDGAAYRDGTWGIDLVACHCPGDYPVERFCPSENDVGVGCDTAASGTVVGYCITQDEATRRCEALYRAQGMDPGNRCVPNEDLVAQCLEAGGDAVTCYPGAT